MVWLLPSSDSSVLSPQVPHLLVPHRTTLVRIYTFLLCKEFLISLEDN